MILRARMQLGPARPRKHHRARAAGKPADQGKARDEQEQGGGVEGHAVLIGQTNPSPSLRAKRSNLQPADQPDDSWRLLRRFAPRNDDSKNRRPGRGHMIPRLQPPRGEIYFNSAPSSGVMLFAAAAAFADTSGGEMTRPLAAR